MVDGLSLRDFPQMFTGAVLVALLAILLDAASSPLIGAGLAGVGRT